MNNFKVVFYLLSIASINATQRNVVLILTDDQDLVLGGLDPMLKTQRLMANYGTTFSNAFATTPICCPSRSSILTGLYLHNHRTVNNSINGGCSNHYWQKKFEPYTFARLLHDNGYKTFYAGKYLNQYGKISTGGTVHVPLGWDWWIGLVGNSRYYNYTLSVNGTSSFRKDDYLTDVIKDYALKFLEQRVVQESSFLMVLAPPAPHAPFTPSLKYKDFFKNVKAKRTLNFNYPVYKDKHWLLRLPPKQLTKSTLKIVDEMYRHRWETLLSVDDLVEEVILKLQSLNLMNSTYVIFTSDHGYHMGQFAQFDDKRLPYEFDVRVPFIIRGPGIPQKFRELNSVLNIDIAPTILHIAGVKSYLPMDGISILSKIGKKKFDERSFLIEYRGEGNDDNVDPICNYNQDNTLSECAPIRDCKCQDSRNNTYNCIREISQVKDRIYCIFKDSENFREMYDMKKDKYQLRNLALTAEENIKEDFEKRINNLILCNSHICL